MFLKSIQIRGFKSFADKTELIFNEGITSIVGPNGSGKSNISDAVRWVLGEQSVKSLRGGKMEDIIFSGTEYRKPVGMAQVSLTLDNNDQKLPLEYSNITVKRKLYRSGESEYFINNTKCRLKEIQQLFMDTGLGKEGYSIIGQGKIDAILSGKPEDRRVILEEAAGIVKFKSRKEEAEKKLKNAEQNLIRIKDILNTYEERLEPLKLESEKARKFVKLSEELKVSEANIIINSLEDIRLKFDKYKDKLLKVKNEIISLKNENNKYKAQKNIYNDELEKVELEFKNKNEEYFNNKTKYKEFKARIELLKEKSNNLSQNINKNFQNIEEIKNKIEYLQKNKSEKQKNIKDFIEKENIYINQINKYEEDLEIFKDKIKDEKELLKKLKDDQIEFLSDISNVKNNMIIIKNEKESLIKKIDELKIFSDNSLKVIEKNNNIKQQLNNKIINIKNKVIEYEKKIDNNKSDIVKLKNNLFNNDKQLKHLNNMFNKLKMNHNVLISLENQYQGYNKSAQNLMKHINSQKIPNTLENCFLLGEILKVKKELETAIGVATGASISNIITLDDKIARRLIKYLKENSLGRVTFLPLNIVKPKKILNKDIERIKTVDGYIGIASQLVECDKKFLRAINHILGRTIICENMESALQIANKSNYSLKIVTLLGEIVNVGGSLTGGSLIHSKNNVIGRKRKIKELGVKLQDIKKQSNILIGTIKNQKENFKKLEEENLNFKDKIYYENIETTKFQGKLNSIENEIKKLEENLKVSYKELNFIKDKKSSNFEELDLKKDLLKKLVQKQNSNEIKISKMELDLKIKNDSLYSLSEKITNIKIKKVKIHEVISNNKNEIERLEKEIQEFNQKLLKDSEEIHKSKEDKRIFEENIKEYNAKIQNIDVFLNSIEDIFKEFNVKKIKLKKNIEINNEHIERISLILSKKEEEYHKLELSTTKLETQKESLYLRLNEEMDITYDEALKYKCEIQDLDKYKKHIQSLKGNISELGIVNVGAIEEHKKIKEKFVFMNTQKEDLINAKEELINVIKAMTKKIKKIFNENFKKIRLYFNETFKELFDGGSADLLLDDGDELTGRIDINVQPPGKKLQNINLMSGGEKGLSAIALLFSILKMKPTPFCILDEIEASLDDANVKRYSEFLSKFCSTVQFIVITHRKGTMEVSDALYGVTMEEKGISKIVSVDLNK